MRPVVQVDGHPHNWSIRSEKPGSYLQALFAVDDLLVEPDLLIEHPREGAPHRHTVTPTEPR